jgi:hypothetical protein
VRLTLHTDFALRVLIQLGLNDGKLTTILSLTAVLVPRLKFIRAGARAW